MRRLTMSNAGHVLLGFLVCVAPLQLQAATGSARSKQVEASLAVQHLSGTTSGGVNTDIEFESMIAYGLGIGYSFTKHVAVNGELIFGSMDLTGTMAGREGEGDATYLRGHVNVDVYLLPTAVSPLLTAGVGLSMFDGTVSSKSSQSDRNTWSVTFDNSGDVSYSLGAGLRWDAADIFSVIAGYQATWGGPAGYDSLMLGGAYMKATFCW